MGGKVRGGRFGGREGQFVDVVVVVVVAVIVVAVDSVRYYCPVRPTGLA